MNTDLFFGVLAAGITLLGVGLQRTYYYYPVRELKRRARKGDQLAQLLYRPVSYGVSLRVLLWSIITLSAAVAFVLLARAFAPWFAIAIIAVLLWIGYLWIPSHRLTYVSTTIARLISPGFTWLLNLLHPILQRVGEMAQRFRHTSLRTGLYEKEDLVNLLEYQKHLPENRIAKAEIDLLTHALTFGDRLVRDAYVPLRAVRLINEAEPIGPKLMDELYKSGYSRFPVYKGEQNKIVGTLYMRDLVKKQAGGHVRDVARDDVFFVHEDFTLFQALQAFLKTKHHLFIVINSFEEFVGIITIEDILEQMIGKQIVDEFDKYDDLRAVAIATAKKEHDERAKTEAEPRPGPTDSDSPEKMVE